MARPLKEGLDYFPFDVDFFMDIKIRRLSKACGPTSQSILICLLCNIYQDKGYYIEWNKDLPFLIADTVGVSEGVVEEVIKKAIQVELFDENIYDRYNVLTSVGIQSRYIVVTERRKKIDWISEYVLIDVVKNEVNDNNNEVNVCNNSVNDNRSTQRKVKESKGKDTKVSKSDDKHSFETFWELYDKKVGKKDKLKKKWEKLNIDTQNQILEYLPKYIKAVPDKQFRKNPETFLNNESWNDEIIEKGGNNGHKFSRESQELDENRRRKEEIAGQFARAVAECDS